MNHEHFWNHHAPPIAFIAVIIFILCGFCYGVSSAMENDDLRHAREQQELTSSSQATDIMKADQKWCDEHVNYMTIGMLGRTFCLRKDGTMVFPLETSDK